MIKIALTIAALIASVTSVSAQTGCYPWESLCHQKEWHNQIHNDAIERMNERRAQERNENFLRDLQAESDARADERFDRLEREMRSLRLD